MDVPEGFALEETHRAQNVLILRLMDVSLNKVGCIVQGYTAPDEHRIYISDVCTYRGYGRRGLATFLLQYLFTWARQRGYNTLQLDDCSDLFGHPNNLYLKLGFRYIVAGQPEMECKL